MANVSSVVHPNLQRFMLDVLDAIYSKQIKRARGLMCARL